MRIALLLTAGKLFENECPLVVLLITQLNSDLVTVIIYASLLKR